MMCSDNCAEDITSYVYGQLRQLHEKAKAESSESMDVKYLAKFSNSEKHLRTDTDPAFSATFGCPCVKFVCNHEIVLFLHILGGRLYYSKVTQEPEPRETIEDCKLAFRIPLMCMSENPAPPDVDSAGYDRMDLVLNLESAVFLLEHSDFTKFTSSFYESAFDTKERKVADLTRCLKNSYFSMLKCAFVHEKLFWLPDSENGRKQLDYSFIHPYPLATDTLFNVHVKDINDYLRSELKLQTVVSAGMRGVQHGTITQSFEPSSEGDDNGMYMSLSFGLLHIQRLCEREIVLYFDIQDIDVDFGSSGEPQQRRTNLEWKIAFVVLVLHEEDKEGSTKIIKADQNTAARFCEHLSNFGGHQGKKLLERIKEPLVNQVKTEYRNILQGMTYIYSSAHGGVADPGENPGSPPDDDTDKYDCMCPDEDSCGHTGGIRWGVIQRRILTETRTGEFDLITALTQRSIDARFKACWKEVQKIGESELKACLAYFSKVVQPERDGEIGYTFRLSAPTVKLVSEDSQTVILYLNISKGSLKILSSERSAQRGTDTREFSGYLAYKVKLETIDSKEGHKQLVLSLASATLDWDQSSVTDMFRGPLADFIEKNYFPVFMRANYHVLCTMSQSISGDPDRRHAFTSLSFKIIPFNYETGTQRLELSIERRRAISKRDAIVIMGVTSNRQLPSYQDPDDQNWICSFGKEVPLGMVYLSRKFFLDDVLKKLEHINCATTIVPILSDIRNDQWVFELALWNVDANCSWNETVKKDNVDSLEFKWTHNEELIRTRDNGLYNKDSYTIGCSTHNIFSVPTSRDGKSVIHLQGKVDMRLKYEGKGKCWSFESTATWSANINFVSTASGLLVQLHPERIEPKFSPVAPEHDRQAQALNKLKAKFPNVIDISGLVDELKKELEGTWTGAQVQAHEYCVAYPMFNAHGDLLLELTVRDKHVESTSGAGTSRSALIRNGSATFGGMNGNGM